MECECCENCLRSRVGNTTAVLKRPTHHPPDHRTTENQATKLGDEAQRLENRRYRTDRPTELDVEESIVIMKLQKRKEKDLIRCTWSVATAQCVRTHVRTYVRKGTKLTS